MNHSVPQMPVPGPGSRLPGVSRIPAPREDVVNSSPSQSSRLPAFAVTPQFEVQGSAVQPLINVCMLCHRSIGHDHRPAGRFIPHGAIVSHGICLDCAPAYCRSMGLTEQETDRIVLSTNTANHQSH